MTRDNTKIHEVWPVPCPYCKDPLRPFRDAHNIVQIETHYCPRTPWESPAARAATLRVLADTSPV